MGSGPAYGRIPGILRAPPRIGRGIEHPHGVPEPEGLKGAVPLENAGADKRAPLDRHGAIDIEDDRPFRFADGAGVALFESPAVHIPQKESVRSVPGEIPDGGHEVSHPIVRVARAHGFFREEHQ